MQSFGPTAGAVDLSAIVIVSSAIGALLGVFLIIIWLQERDIRAFAWWGAAYLIGASSIALATGPAPVVELPPAVSGALIFVACGMIWNGVRLFHGRKILLTATFGGALAWIAAMSFVPPDAQAGSDGAGIGAVILGVHTFGIAWELWRERRRSLFSRAAAVAVPLMHAAMFIGPLSLRRYHLFGSHDGWLVVFALETMIYSVGVAFIVMLMVKDHHVRLQRAAAATDPLTGLLNRRAFASAAQALLARQQRTAGPVALMMFDLDRFKQINDRFGHATGDDVLRLFATTLRGSLRADDILARLGGEEIAAVAPADADAAARIAERVRANFAAAGARLGGRDLNATVSIGIAVATDAIETIDALMARADVALYRAKARGRNRIATAGPDDRLTAEAGPEREAPDPAPDLAPDLAPDGALRGHA